MAFSLLVTKLAEGLLVAIAIFALTLLFSLPLGLLVAFGRMSRNFLLRNLIKLYISIMRGTPLVLQLMVVYFGPYFLFRINISHGYRFVATIIGFSLNYAAYFAEIYRGGIMSMPAGQYEAAQVLGYSKAQTFVRIIFPQVVKRILPAVTNEVITLVKDTALAFAISVPEMFTAAKAIAAAQGKMLPFVVAGVFYYIFNIVVAFAMEAVEKRLSYYQ
ncbi:MAG TPA: amino acid ABC transporter permease [Firmicutes bacterium]|nr:amino acid ABC transporter permease [Bacillota bacterium]